MVFDFWFYFMQGVPGIIASLALTKTLALICDIERDAFLTYLPIFTGMGRGSTQDPPCRAFEHFKFLHCCRNLELFWSFTIGSAASEPSSEQGRRSLLRTEVHVGSSNLLLSGYLKCFCT